MDIIAFIEGPSIIRKILQHLGLWDRPARSPPHRLFPHKMETLLQSLTPRKALCSEFDNVLSFYFRISIFFPDFL